MMPNITRGARTRGLLGYLWGPGKSDEHTNPHLVAGFDDPAVLEPAKRADGTVDPAALTDLAAMLDFALDLQQQRGPKTPKHVWQCSLSLAADEGTLGDAKWKAIAERFIEEMGLADCRWVAVHHGLSKNGNDHIHLAVVLANTDGSKPRMHQDARRSQQVVDALEDEFGLVKRTPGRGKAMGRKAASREEVSRADREEQPLARTALRRAVRAAVAGARSEAEWLANLAQAGVQVRPRVDEEGRVTGYSARLPEDHPAGDAWFAGSTLDQELSLPRLRDRWGGEPLPETAWAAAGDRSEERRALSAAERAEIWSGAARRIRAGAKELKDLPDDDPQWPAAAQACADVLVQAVVLVEPDDAEGELSVAADLLVRACAPDRHARELDRRLAEKIGIVGAQLRAAGAAQRRGEESLLAAVVVAIVQLAVVVAAWRAAQEDRAAANVARTSASRLKPFVERVPVPTARTAPERGRAAAMPMPPRARGRDAGPEPGPDRQ